MEGSSWLSSFSLLMSSFESWIRRLPGCHSFLCSVTCCDESNWLQRVWWMTWGQVPAGSQRPGSWGPLPLLPISTSSSLLGSKWAVELTTEKQGTRRRTARTRFSWDNLVTSAADYPTQTPIIYASALDYRSININYANCFLKQVKKVP